MKDLRSEYAANQAIANTKPVRRPAKAKPAKPFRKLRGWLWRQFNV